jgi:UDP-N-acetylglucosamine acyltransferase
LSVDPSAYIAPTARVDPGAAIAANVRVGEFCVIESDVVIGANCALEPYVYVKRWTTLGERNADLRIGNDNIIREHYTISRGTEPESVTEIGNANYIMTSGHIAHNCKIGNSTVICSCALVAGYVEVEDQAFISGGVVIHQFSRIGRLAMIGGNTRVNSDVPPFFLYSGFNVEAKGVNLVGLKRAGFDTSQITALKNAYRLLYRSGLKLEEALRRIGTQVGTPEAAHLVNFVRQSKRGICREG